MQIKIFSIPILGGEAINEEMNVFLRSKRVLSTEKQLAVVGGNAYWSFCISYLEALAMPDKDRPKVDYRQVLDEASFKRFSTLRDIRKRVAAEDAVPAYAVFTDEELSMLAKFEALTEANIKSVKGIGERKVEKYARFFIENTTDEKGR